MTHPIRKAIQAADYAAVLSAVSALPAWTAEIVDSLHTALVGWCERALSAPLSKDDGNAAALYDLLGRLRASHGEASLNTARPDTAAQWVGLELVLAERVAKLGLLDSQRDAVLKRRHVHSVLALLRQKEQVEQGELANRVHVSDSTMSQVLARMEAATMVVRERDPHDGRTRLVRLTDRERAMESASQSATRASANGGVALAFPTLIGVA
jgi:DNA-binding MarR family transcriptional regulator